MKTRTRREFVKGMLTGAAACALGSRLGARSSARAAEKPNILLIMADDMGWSDVGCYGGEVRTPNIDWLAANGVRFTQAYNTAKCFPSRACALTGVYAQQCGMDVRHGALKRAVTLGEVLRTAGYRTLWSGKHHGTENPYTRGFDRYFGLRDGCCNFWNPGNQRPGEGPPARKRVRTWCIDEETYKPYTPPDPKFYTTDAFTDRALSWLDQYEDDGKPFFLYMAYNAPHYPLHAWPEDIAKYRGVYDRGYDAIRQTRYRRQLRTGLLDARSAPLPDSAYRSWSGLSRDERAKEIRRMEIYAAMTDRLDQNVGRILQKLRAQGKLENTLVMFCSDNGACAEMPKVKQSGEMGTVTSYPVLGRSWAEVSNTPLRKYKNYSHEGGICTPLVAYWPKEIRDKGAIRRDPVHFIDFMATFADVAGARYPTRGPNGQQVTPLQGVSIRPAFGGKPPKREKPIFWQWSRGRAIRKGDLKLVEWNGQWELCNIANNRTETRNLIDAHPETVKALREEWSAWYRSCTGKGYGRDRKGG